MHCQVRFHSLVIRHADMVLTHGVSPSVCHVLAIPGAIPFAPGLLSFEEDTGNSVTFKDCAINRVGVKSVSTPRGIRLSIQILDRRWRWKYRRVSGEYNQLRRDGDFQGSTKKTYVELLEILLDALGETQYVIDIPDTSHPGVHVCWKQARADLELAELLDSIGCIVTLGLDDRVRICINGDGPTYNDNGREKLPLVSTVPSTLPERVVVLFDDTRIQCPLVLEAVGLETDRNIVPIDDLSYMPVNWNNSAPDWFPALSASNRQLARRSVFKWYAAMNPWPDMRPYNLPDGPIISSALSAERCLPIEESLLEHPADELSRPSTPYILGDLWQGDLAGTTVLDATETERFTLDHERGVVCFDQPIMRCDAATVPSQAEISLVCAFRVRNETTNEFHRYSYAKFTGTNADPGAGDAVVFVPGVYLTCRYDIESESWHDNRANLDSYADMVANSFLKSFANIPQAEQEWVGLVPLPVQGNIHMMQWVVSSNRCMTYGYKNMESALVAPVHHERRMREIAQGVLA